MAMSERLKLALYRLLSALMAARNGGFLFAVALFIFAPSAAAVPAAMAALSFAAAWLFMQVAILTLDGDRSNRTPTILVGLAAAMAVQGYVMIALAAASWITGG